MEELHDRGAAGQSKHREDLFLDQSAEHAVARRYGADQSSREDPTAGVTKELCGSENNSVRRSPGAGQR